MYVFFYRSCGGDQPNIAILAMRSVWSVPHKGEHDKLGEVDRVGGWVGRMCGENGT